MKTSRKEEYKDVWIVAEQKNGILSKVSFELVTRGLELSKKKSSKLCAVLMSAGCSEQELQKLLDRGVDLIISYEAPQLESFLPEPYANCLLDLIRKFKPEIILAAATSTGRTLMPYVAMEEDTGLTADCTKLEIADDGNLLQTRPAIGGNIMATIITPDHRPQMATVRPHSTKPAEIIQKSRNGKIIRINPEKNLLNSQILREGFIPLEEKQGLQDAEKVVVVGRGIKKAENILLAQKLAEVLGASLGATRDVVDRGWLSYPHQIGLSGKTITPKLYIGLGVSGSIQHLAGMQTSETIIAINTDPEAQIFKVADFGIVGDLFAVVPVLIEKIKAKGASSLLEKS